MPLHPLQRVRMTESTAWTHHPWRLGQGTLGHHSAGITMKSLPLYQFITVPVKAERASLAPDVVITLTAEVVTPDVHLALPVEVVQSVSSPQTASVSLTHQHELQRAMITSVDSDSTVAQAPEQHRGNRRQ